MNMNPTPCLSYWQNSTRTFSHLNENSTSPLPHRAKYVIIGSGLAGSLSAFELLNAGVKPEDLVILEGREAASGASSWNAGHVRPDAFRGFTAYSNIHGPTQALKIIENERLVLHKIHDFIEKYNVPCDFNYTTTFDVCMTDSFAEYEEQSLQRYKDAGGDVSHVKCHQGVEAAQRTEIPDAVAAYEWPAASIHPAKLVHFLLSSVIGRGVRLFTHCVATSVTRHPPSPSSSSSPRLEAPSGFDEGLWWTIHTPRGTLTTSRIIHCTKAHTALTSSTMHNAKPRASAFPPPTKTTIIDNAHPRGRKQPREYRQTDDGMLVSGVSRTNPTLSPETRAGVVSTDDSGYNGEIAGDAMCAFARLFPDAAGRDEEDGGGGELDHAWTGIIAMTKDSVPFVGELLSVAQGVADGAGDGGSVGGGTGQFVCAGFNGHGMATIFTCAAGIARLVMGGSWAETGLPECFAVGGERLGRLQSEDVPSVW